MKILINRCLSTILTLLFCSIASGCSVDKVLIFMMETSTEELFVQSCEADIECVKSAEEFVSVCYDKEHARKVIDAKTDEEKRQLNIALIKSVKQCVQLKSGNDIWESIDVTSRYLEKAD